MRIIIIIIIIFIIITCIISIIIMVKRMFICIYRPICTILFGWCTAISLRAYGDLTAL